MPYVEAINRIHLDSDITVRINVKYVTLEVAAGMLQLLHSTFTQKRAMVCVCVCICVCVNDKMEFFCMLMLTWWV